MFKQITIIILFMIFFKFLAKKIKLKKRTALFSMMFRNLYNYFVYFGTKNISYYRISYRFRKTLVKD